MDEKKINIKHIKAKTLDLLFSYFPKYITFYF